MKILTVANVVDQQPYMSTIVMIVELIEIYKIKNWKVTYEQQKYFVIGLFFFHVV